MRTDPEPILPLLAEAVRAASRVCRAVQATLRPSDSVAKPDASPVTVADLASQAIVSHLLATWVPELPLCGEEDATPLRGPERAGLRAEVLARVRTEWPGATEDDVLRALDRGSHAGGADGRFLTLDPIDGTKGFLRGEQYAVALAMIDGGRVVAGALGCPNLEGPAGSGGALLLAARGGGTVHASLSGGGVAGRVARTSRESDPRRIRVCESVESAHSDQGATGTILARLRTEAAPVRLDSQAKYAVLACGGAELYLRSPTREDRREWIWDHAAGVIVVEEAGGRVTDLSGASLDFSRGRRLEGNRGVIASNGLVHDAVVAEARRA